MECSECRHYRRTQRGPNYWTVDCALAQADFPEAEYCGFYAPPQTPDPGRETGLGYVWDNEFEGPA